MKSEGRIYAVVAFLMACAFGFGIHLLLSERFYRGDSYPPYSTFRSDPLGARALYLALERVPGIKARRNFTRLSRLPKEAGRTYFFLGADKMWQAPAPGPELAELEKLAREGNRLVIALYLPPVATEEADSPGKDNPDKVPRKGPEPSEPTLADWGLSLSRIPAGENRVKGTLKAMRVEEETGLPDSITLRSNICFKADERFWKTLYAVEGRPVVMERIFGKGSLVLLADSYPAGNSSLKEERQPGLLLRLLGGNRVAVFDETHLGVFERPGIITLMDKFGLTPFLAALVLLAGLCVWRNAVPLVPSHRAESNDACGAPEGRDAVGGLVTLLRRNVPTAGLLDVCLAEWTKSFSREFRGDPGTLEELRAVAAGEAGKPASRRDPAAGCRRMVQILAERKRR